MSRQAGSKKDYLLVFEGFPEVTGFFSLKSGAVEGSPYDNQAVFRQLEVENAVRIFPKQIHKKHVAVIRQEDVEAAADSSIIIPFSGMRSVIVMLCFGYI